MFGDGLDPLSSKLAPVSHLRVTWFICNLYYSAHGSVPVVRYCCFGGFFLNME